MAFGKLFVDLALRDKGFTASLKNAGGSVKQFEGTVNGLSRVVGGTLVKSFKAGTLAIGAFGVASAKIGSDFEHSITLVKSLSKDGIDNFAALTDEARRLGATTEFSARQSAEAMTNFARAGMDARQIIAATGPALMLAGGAGESMSLATLTMAASLRQFSLDASQSQHVADVFTLALKNSLFNLQGLNDAMKYAGPAGAAFGMSVEETTAAVAQFRNMGLDASMAGTAFRMSMVALAKQTPAMTKVMEKYGITSEQVSVTNIGFAKVLNNLADAGITAEDAIKMFGARAGANMGLLIEQMRKPEMRQGFKDLTEDLYASSQGAGAAKEQYDEMGKTVQRQFLIAKSAFEELLITTFDTYKADLADFFAALGEVLQATADTFNGLSVAGGGFNNVLQKSTQFLRENKSEIAQFFINVFNGVQKTMEVVLALTPLVKLLAEAFLVAFPTLAVASFAIGITSLKAAFAVATAAAASFGVTLNIALGPIGLVAVGITAVITALVKLDSALNTTEGAAKRYNSEIERIAAQHKGWASQTSKLHGKTIALQKENFEKHAEYMRSLGASEAQIERYRQRLEALTDEQVQQQLEAGTLIEVTRDGATEFHNVAMAAQMLGEEGYAPLEKRIEETKRAVEDQEESNARLQARINMLMGVEDEFTHILEARGMTQEHLRNVMKASGETLESWKAQLTVGNDRLKQFKANVGGAVNALNNYRLAVIGAKEGGPVDFGQGIGPGTVPDKPDDTAQKEYQKRQERKAQMLQDLLRMEEDYQAELAKIGLKGIDLKKFELDEIKKEINRAHDDQLKDAKDLNIKKQIEESRANSLRMATSIAVRQAEVEAEEEAIEYQAALAAKKQEIIGQVEEAAQEQRFDREMQVESAHWNLMRDLEIHNITLTEQEKLAIESDFQQQRLNAAIGDLQARLRFEKRSATFAEKLNIAKLKSGIKTRNKILESERRSQLKQQRLALKAAKIQEKIDSTTNQKKKKRLKERLKSVKAAAAAEVHDNIVKNRKILNNEEQKFKLIEKMQKIASKTGLKAIGDGAKKAGSFIGKVKDAMEDAQQEQPQTGWGKFIKGAGKAVAAVKMVAKGISALGKKAVGVFSSMTGFSFDPMAMVDEAAGKKEEMGDAAVEAEAARREEAGEEEMTAEEEAAVRAEGEAGFDPKAAAAEVAEQQAQAMTDRLNMALEMIPVFVQKLAENLPPLIKAFVDGFPEMVTALVDALSGENGLLLVIARAIPDLISVLVESIPQFIPPIVDALFEFIANGIPQIVESLTTVIPQLIMGLAEGLPLLIEAIVVMIPQVIQSIIEMLPQFLESIIALVMNLVVALLEQIPVLIVELVNQIPVLITALVDAIPLIITQVVEALPKIITALVNAIPVIILGLIKAIPKIIEAVIRGIPQIIMGLLKGIVGILDAIFVKLPVMLANAIGKAFREAWKGIKKAFSSLFEALNPANWFGDTPGAVKVGTQPQTFGFMPNDYVIAAQRPSDLLQQASELIEKKGIPKITRGNRQSAVAQMSAAPLGSMFGGTLPQASPAQRLAQNIKVEVEGETIDNALITAKDRGHSPQIWNEIDRVAGGGASVGIERHDAE